VDIGVIGVGSMGKNHMRVYSEQRNVDSLFVFDLNKAEMERIAAQYEATACTSVTDLFHAVDAVSICVPTRFHREVALLAVSSGVHALIEKPICASAQEGEALLAQIPPCLTIGVGHIERFNPIVNEIRRIMREPLYVELKRHNPSSSRVTDT
jgi:predicted dehydrogenase